MRIVQYSVTPKDLRRPLEVIRTEHGRQHDVSHWLLELARDRALDHLCAEATALVTFLTEDLVLHHRDEEEDLFPLLRKRCLSEDSIEAILAELDQDHSTERFLVRHITADLHTLAAAQTLPRPSSFFDDLVCFAEGQQRHLAWENAQVLPLADRRLTQEDLIGVARNMALRRGVGFSI